MKAPRPNVMSRKPGRSKPACACSSLDSLMYFSVPRMAMMPSGMLMKNDQRQDRLVVSQPPSSGPMAATPPMTAPQMPNAMARSRPRKLVFRIDCVAGRIMAPPTPWSRRAAMSWVPSWAAPAMTDATMKITRPPRYISRRPRWSPSRPRVMRSAANTSA